MTVTRPEVGLVVALSGDELLVEVGEIGIEGTVGVTVHDLQIGVHHCRLADSSLGRAGL